MSGKILPLSESVRSKLRSGITITSIAQCVEEMVLNSIDANATCIAVRIDPAIFRIQVVDNGDGVTEENLKLLGKRHSTSKCHSLEDLNSNLGHYGFRGEALASLVEVAAIVDITTRPRGSVQTLTKIFAYGKEKSISVSKVPRPSVGTTITVQDFMYNMPVRRKLMKEAIDIENIRVRLESFALIHPKISLSLRNDSGQSKVMHTNKSNSTLSTFMQLFGLEKSQGLVEVDHTVDQFTVTGYISVQPHLTKALQFIYVNKRVVLKTKIHKMMNYLLARTSIISNRLHPAAPLPGKSPSSPPKGLKLHGIYVINIECPPKEYDICMDPTKTLVEFRDWDKLLLCIEEMVIKFAEEERLAISLDERYRRSGRDQVMAEEESQAEPHSSQALLQVFSLKRSGENSNSKGEPQEKYGRTLCTYDNLSAVHSIPVRRKNNDKNSQRYNEIDSDDDEVVLRADEEREIDNETYHPSDICVSKETDVLISERIGESCDNNSPSSSSKQSLSPRIPSTRSPEKIQEARNKVRSSLDMFRRMITQSDSDASTPHPPCEDHSVSKATELKETGRSNSETHDEAYNKDTNKKRSSLEEFRSFYNEDLKKCKQESYETPKELIRSPPREPPPLRVASSPPTSTEDISQDACVLPVIKNRGGDEGQKYKKSLSKTLSEGWKKHQAKAESLKCLQKFEFQRKSSDQSRCINESTSYEVAQRGKNSPKSNLGNTERKTRYQTRKSLHHKMKDSVTVQTSDTESDNDASGKAADLDCSFKFQPVLESEINEVKSPENEGILDDTFSHTSTDRFQRTSLGSKIVTLSKEPTGRSTQNAAANDDNKCSEIGDSREEIERLIPDKNCVENSKNHEVHEPSISQASDTEAFTTDNEPDLGHQEVNQSGNMKKYTFQTDSEQGERFAKDYHTAKKNSNYYCKEISPTQPFVIEGISSEKNKTCSTQEVITEQSSDKVQDDTQEGSRLLSAFIDDDPVDSTDKCYLKGNDLEVPDAPKNVKQLKLCHSENDKDVYMEYVGENQTICNSINAYSIQEHDEALPPSKDNYPNSEVNFRLCESTSQISSTENDITESPISNGSFRAAVAAIKSSDDYSQMEMKSHNRYIQSPPHNSSDNPGSQNPLSASIHFSELTIPSTGDSPSISQCASSLGDTCNAKTLFGSSVPSLSSDTSCMTEKPESTKSKFPSYNIVFHGKMIHIDGKNPSEAPMDQRGVCHTINQETSPKLLEQNSSNLESESLFEKTSGKEKDDLVESDVPIKSSSGIEFSNDNPQNSEDKVFNNEIVSKKATRKNNTVHLEDNSSCDTTHSSKADCIIEHNPKQSESNYLRNLWKEANDESGRKVYINLQTGNTSYEAPVVKEMPEWTSSQPQGAPVLKIPLSEEPEAEGSRQKQDFVLTHGYSAFMSWKKSREMQKKEMEKSEIKISGCAYDSRDTQQDQYRQEAVSKGEECESLISPGMKEAIQSILQDSEMDDDSIKWSEKPSNLGSLEEDSSEVAQICQDWEPPTFAMDADILSSKVQAGSERGVNKDSSVKIYNIVHPYKFSQEMLQTCRVLGQLDKKFIACEITYTSSDPTLHKVSEIIVLFDQHAVHERVRLETLTEENYETLENGERVIRTCMITPPLEMTLPESEVRLMMAYAKTFILWGLHFTQVSASQVNFQSIPSILVARERHELRQRRCQSATAIIESIVRDVCYTLHQTGGIVSTMPKPLMNVLCSQACRGAIKFGDELSYDECKNLVKSLSSCALPFQCAHGRPSIVPVVNLTHLAKGRKKERKPNLHKLREAIEEEMLGEEIMD